MLAEVAWQWNSLVILEGKVLLRNLLQAKNNSAGGSIGPDTTWNESSTSSLILRILENALEVGVGGGTLDGDGVAGIDEGLDDRGGERAVLERLLLGAEEDSRVGHDCD